MKIQIGYGQIDPSAKPDSTPTANDKQPWSNLQDLKIDGLTTKNIATLEHNQGILDGSQEHMPDDPENYKWGLWSESMSDSNGNFTNPPTLDIGFSFNHKSPGITLIFYPHSEDWANRVHITWYDSVGIVEEGMYSINSTTGYIEQNVLNFRRIVIEFLSTNIRNRYIKLSGINYGEGQSFEDGDIDKANILEEIDPTSNEITINTLGFNIRTKDPKFSLVSGHGDEMLMRNQPMQVVADEKTFGTYFLQSWKDSYGNGSVIEFQAIDAIGVMDKYDFWGDIYANVDIDLILSQLFAICFPTQLIRYQIDPALVGKRVSGWIPKCKCREALQLVCFAIGAIADDSRRDYVWIYPSDNDIDSTIPLNQIYKGPAMQPTEYFSGVSVVSHEYVPSYETIEAYKGELTQGSNIIQLSEPLHSLSIDGANILASTSNYAVIDVLVNGEYVLTGNKYIVNQQVFLAREDVAAGEVENIKPYDKCTMLSPSDAQARAELLFAYLKQRTQFDGDIRLNDREVGYKYQVETRNLPIDGTLEQLDINIRAGKARAKVIGDVDTTDNRSNAG